MKSFNHSNLKDALQNTTFFVEAGDSFTRHALWAIWVEHNESPLKWQSISQGFWQSIGITCCNFSFAYIMDQLVCFYEPTSTKVDWDEVEGFLSPFWSPKEAEGRKRKCNASNFHQCIGYLRSTIK